MRTCPRAGKVVTAESGIMATMVAIMVAIMAEMGAEMGIEIGEVAHADLLSQKILHERRRPSQQVLHLLWWFQGTTHHRLTMQ